MAEESQPSQTPQYSSGYGKRPLWQWIVIYLIIAAIVYGLVYYFVFAQKGGYNYGASQPQNNQQQGTPSGY